MDAVGELVVGARHRDELGEPAIRVGLLLAQYFDQSDNRFLMIPFPRDPKDPMKVDQKALATQIDKEIEWLRKEGKHRHGPGQTEVLIAQLEALKKRAILGPNETT